MSDTSLTKNFPESSALDDDRNKVQAVNQDLSTPTSIFNTRPGLYLSHNSLALTTPLPLTRHPAAVYLASLGLGSRPTMRGSLNAIAAMLTSGRSDAMTLDWSKLRYQHTAAVRAVLIENYSPATANKMLSALKRVLLEARKLDLMLESDYKLAIDLGRRANAPCQ